MPSPESCRWPCLARRGGELVLDVVVSPNARRTRADGLHDGALRVRLAAPPVEGKANAMLIDWLADELGLPRRAAAPRGVVAARRSGRRRARTGNSGSNAALELGARPRAAAPSSTSCWRSS
jgi:hypothetical protein